MLLYQYKDKSPNIDQSAMVFDNAVVIGDVTLCAGVGVWPGVTIRADNDSITIKENTNIQESAVLHVDPGFPMQLGPNVTVGHQAMLHGCVVGEGTLIGIGAVVLNGAKIGKDCLIGAGALIPEGREIPDRSVVIGIGKIVRTLTDEEADEIRADAAKYAEKARNISLNLKCI